MSRRWSKIQKTKCVLKNDLLLVVQTVLGENIHFHAPLNANLGSKCEDFCLQNHHKVHLYMHEVEDG